MGQKPPARTLYHISCPCGGVFSMDARGFGRPIVCKKCGGSYTIGWGKDPKTQRTAPIAVALARKSGPTPLQVACACGYRRAVTASEPAGHNRCPGCGKAMIVIKPTAPRPQDVQKLVSLSGPPAAAPTPSTSSQGGSEPRLVRISAGTQTVDCVCGEKIFVRNEQQLISCPGCSRKIRVEVKDKSSASFPRVVPGSRTPTPPPGFTCECGRQLEITRAFDSNGTVCPGCGRSITMEKVRGPQTKHTIIRPRFGPKGGPPPVSKTPAPPASDGILELPPVEFKEEEAAPVARQDHRAHPVFCPCGEALMVGAESIGRNVQCPTCMTLIAVDQIRDSASGNYVLRVRAIGKMDQDTWSLNDFS